MTVDDDMMHTSNRKKEKKEEPHPPLWILGYGSLIFKPPPYTKYKLSGFIHGYIRRFWQSSSDHRGTPESPGRVATLISLKDLQQNPELLIDFDKFDRKGSGLGAGSGFGQGDALMATDISKLQDDDLKIWGSLYYIPSEHAAEVIEYLDEREQDGYTQHEVKFNIELSQQQLDDPKLMTLLDESLLNNTAGTDADTGNNNNNYQIHSKVYIGTLENESFIGPEKIEETAKIVSSNIGPSGANVEYLDKLVFALRHLDAEMRSHDWYLEELLALAKGTAIDR